MKKNIQLNVAYIFYKDTGSCLFSLNKAILENHLKNIDGENFFRYDLTIKSRLMKNLHNAAAHLLKQDELYIAPTVSCENELIKWILIKNKSYIPESAFETFLSNNGLLDDWIEGKLKAEICHHYTEFSREFGHRERIKTDTVHLSDSNSLWVFSSFFEGEVIEHSNHSAKFRYQTESKAISIGNDNFTFEINRDWLERVSFKEPKTHTFY